MIKKLTLREMPIRLPFCRYVLMAFLTVMAAVQSVSAHAQSIQSGVTFQWADIQTSANQPATLDGITVDGVSYDTLIAPSGYEMLQVGPGGPGTNRIRQNGVTLENNSTSPTWDSTATAAFSSRNLNFYFEASSTNDNAEICDNEAAIATTSNQIQRLSYGAGVRATTGSILAVTERNSNNCFYIRLTGIPAGGGPEQVLGGTFVRSSGLTNGSTVRPPANGGDYWASGRVHENNGSIGIAMFVLDPLLPVGSIITKVDFIAATRDHGDGKVFLIKTSEPIVANDDTSSAVDGGAGATDIINVLDNDDLRGFPPTASSATISIVTPSSEPGVTLDTATGGVSVAANTPPGNYQIVYQICETADPTNCDTATVTVPVAGLRVVKTSVVVTDPVNGSTNPKAIPGAVVRYCIQVENEATSVTAESINVVDDLSALPIQFLPGTIRVNGTIVGNDCDFSTGSPGGNFSGSTVSGTLNDLAPGERRALYFDVELQ